MTAPRLPLGPPLVLLAAFMLAGGCDCDGAGPEPDPADPAGEDRAAEPAGRGSASGVGSEGGEPSGSEPAGSTPAGSTPAGSTPAGSEPAGEPGKTTELGAVTVTEHDDGRVRIRATDRWETQYNRAFESPAYLRDALPVLERRLGEDAAGRLETWLDEQHPEGDR